jgi:putative phosphoribosyl transferase
MQPADPLVAALPRGGVPVGFEVADALGCELDVLVVRKVGVPHQPELAMGAVAEGGVTIQNQEILRMARVSPREFDHEADLARRELSRRLAVYRDSVAAVEPEGRTVIVVDDGLATGSTAEAAIAAVRSRGAAAAWLAVPVAPGDTVHRLGRMADRVIVLETPRRFLAVGAWYLDFAQTSDAEVLDLLERSRS